MLAYHCQPAHHRSKYAEYPAADDVAAHTGHKASVFMLMPAASSMNKESVKLSVCGYNDRRSLIKVASGAAIMQDVTEEDRLVACIYR